MLARVLLGQCALAQAAGHAAAGTLRQLLSCTVTCGTDRVSWCSYVSAASSSPTCIDGDAANQRTDCSLVPSTSDAADADSRLAVNKEIFFAPPSSDRFLEPLSASQRHAHRARAAQLCRMGELQYVRIGKHQVTHAFLNQCADLLAHHEIIRVRVSGQSGLDVGFVKFLLESQLDCAAIQTSGKTVTLYRTKGLPKAVIRNTELAMDSHFVHFGAQQPALEVDIR